MVFQYRIHKVNAVNGQLRRVNFKKSVYTNILQKTIKIILVKSQHEWTVLKILKSNIIQTFLHV